jgi:hypothetical protein
MRAGRLLLHPVLLNRRSRSLLLWYLLSSCVTSLLLWWRLGQLAAASGVDLSAAALGAPPLGRVLLAPYVRVLVAIASAGIATGITAIAIVGPIRRIEEWLTAWERGLDIRPLRVREGDPYETIMRLLNELRVKWARRDLLGRRLRGPLASPEPRGEAD